MGRSRLLSVSLAPYTSTFDMIIVALIAGVVLKQETKYLHEVYLHQAPFHRPLYKRPDLHDIDSQPYF